MSPTMLLSGLTRPIHGRSVVIANNKDDDGGGIGVFDMNGKLIQFNREGEIGNVDLRTGFPGGKEVRRSRRCK